MTIGLPFAPPAVGGGGYRVLRMLEGYLTAHAIPWTRSVRKADAVLLSSWHSPLRTAVWAQSLGLRVVHRIANTPAGQGRQAPALARRLEGINRRADASIAQSEAIARTLPGHPNRVIIPNPVDLDTFRPDGPTATLPHWDGLRVSAVAWSPHPRKGADELARLIVARPDLQVVLVGRWPDLPAFQAKNVVRVGVLDAAGVAAVHRACDLLATFAQDEAGPNHVLEAMACGRPVLYRDQGAVREYVGEAGGTSLDDVLERREALGAAARDRVVRTHAPRVVFDAYLRVLRGDL